jgi:hypothetical protein
MFTQKKDEYKQKASSDIQSMLLVPADSANNFVSEQDTKTSMLITKWLPTFQKYLLFQFFPNQDSFRGFFLSDLHLSEEVIILSKRIFANAEQFNEFQSVTAAIFNDYNLLFGLYRLNGALGKMREIWGPGFPRLAQLPLIHPQSRKVY